MPRALPYQISLNTLYSQTFFNFFFRAGTFSLRAVQVQAVSCGLIPVFCLGLDALGLW